MGVAPNVSHDKFPKQGPNLNTRMRVVFNYDLTHELRGTVVRDDYEEPWKTIIQLDNGHYVMSTECQYSPI